VSDPAPSPSWALLVPFIAAPGFPLKETRTITLGGRPAVLGPGSFGYSNLLVEDIDSVQSANSLFEALRIGLLIFGLNLNAGVRVSDNLQILDHGSPVPAEEGVPLIFPAGKDLRRISVGSPLIQFQVDKIIPKIRSNLELGLSSELAKKAMANDRVRLAFELCADSYFEASDSAQFIGLISVLEVLKDKADASDVACNLVDRWSREASEQLSTDEAASIKGSLHYLKLISISKGIGSVVGRHLGEDRVKEARGLYQDRSALVHDGIRPDNFPDVLNRSRKMVTELLARIIMSGSL
jgi:hypothetical protein